MLVSGPGGTDRERRMFIPLTSHGLVLVRLPVVNWVWKMKNGEVGSNLRVYTPPYLTGWSGVPYQVRQSYQNHGNRKLNPLSIIGLHRHTEWSTGRLGYLEVGVGKTGGSRNDVLSSGLTTQKE